MSHENTTYGQETTDPEVIDLLRQCYVLAQRSSDPSSKNGSVLRTYNQHYHLGWNGPPGSLGLHYDVAKISRDEKLFVTEHAERDAIFACIRASHSPIDSDLFCSWAACPDCAKAIIGCRVRRVVYHKQALDRTPDRWQLSIDFAMKMLIQQGVRVEYFDGKLDAVVALLDGQEWNP